MDEGRRYVKGREWKQKACDERLLPQIPPPASQRIKCPHIRAVPDRLAPTLSLAGWPSRPRRLTLSHTAVPSPSYKGALEAALWPVPSIVTPSSLHPPRLRTSHGTTSLAIHIYRECHRLNDRLELRIEVIGCFRTRSRSLSTRKCQQCRIGRGDIPTSCLYRHSISQRRRIRNSSMRVKSGFSCDSIDET